MKRFFLLLIIISASSIASAADWPNWRGPYYNGSTDEKNLPANWSRTENVAWSVDLPGPSAATPIISGDKIFLSSTNTENDSLLAMALDRKSGKILWQHQIAIGSSKDYRSTLAAPSPVTDGKIVTFFYGNGDLVTFDIDGRKLWSRNIQKDYGPFAFLWTFSSTPALFDGKLFLQVLQRDVAVSGKGFADKPNLSYILAIDQKTGKTIYKQHRPSEAIAESREAFTTPIPATIAGKKQLLVVGGDALTSHDLATGKELWRWETWNPSRIHHWRVVPTPVVGEGLVIVCAPKNEPLYAIKPGKKEATLAWKTTDSDVTSDVPTPAFYDGDFFVLSDKRHTLSRIEAKTGKTKWSITAPGEIKHEASPLAADGKIYTINHDGYAAAIDAKTGKILNEVSMDTPKDRNIVRSSIIASGEQIFIRTTQKLYCIGK
jgi:outer membrane protein assembly factor BamB